METNHAAPSDTNLPLISYFHSSDFFWSRLLWAKISLFCDEIPLLLISEMRIASDLYGQNWWYYLKEGYYKNISWKDISWKVILAFFNLGKKSDEWQLICIPLQVLINMNGSSWKREHNDRLSLFFPWLKKKPQISIFFFEWWNCHWQCQLSSTNKSVVSLPAVSVCSKSRPE